MGYEGYASWSDPVGRAAGNSDGLVSIPEEGTKVLSQGAVTQSGIVGRPVPGLPGFVMVEWADGQVVEEYAGDITVPE